jgi:hypothetical protein
VFCRKCGTQIPDDSVYCTKCGTPVQVIGSAGPAAQAADFVEVFKGVTAKDQFDLHVTSTRFVMIKTQSAGSGAGSLLGPVGSIVELGVSRARKKKHDDGLTLDQKLRRDKGSFAVDYVVVDTIKLGKGRLGGNIMQVRYADEKGSFRKVDITVSGDQFERLGVLIPSIPALAPKFALKR